MTLLKTIITILIILTCSTAMAFTGKCVKVSDADTIQVLDEQNKITKVRLYGIDCPEKSQAFGQKAKEFVLSQVGGKDVDVDVIDIDKYQRSVAVVKFDDKILNEEILKAGFGWYYAQYCKESFCKNWQLLESQAKLSKIGLWSDVHASPPWEYRHGGTSVSTDTLPQSPTEVDSNVEGEYHGNVDSRKFHKSSCRYYSCKNCTAVFKSKSDAEKAGYIGCKVCNP